MAGKILIGLGMLFTIGGGLLYLAVMSTVSIAAGYQASVQEYAHSNQLIGATIASWIAGFGILLACSGGLVLGMRRMRRA
ncbi:MAG TPA: hypothetical protein PKA05_07875 [Roseiflexaceae bacterium]|nr:hypothetical protein [Roseiflexaceae bacterium]HMP40281.1 hypothetical protein [Roseiflexaceae bacterium]